MRITQESVKDGRLTGLYRVDFHENEHCRSLGWCIERVSEYREVEVEPDGKVSARSPGGSRFCLGHEDLTRIVQSLDAEGYTNWGGE